MECDDLSKLLEEIIYLLVLATAKVKADLQRPLGALVLLRPEEHSHDVENRIED